MKKVLQGFVLVLFALFVVHLFNINAFAKTATITYTYTDFANSQVHIYAEEGTDIGGTTPAVHNHIDADEDGVVTADNLMAGTSYCFRARAYNKLTAVPSGWSNEICVDIPADTIPGETTLPPIPVTPGMTITISVN